jgi:hypothetical protein
MSTRPLGLMLVLVAAVGAVAAPLPTRWSLDLACQELGWRFRQEFAVWPGLYWRGPEQPPVAARPEDPATWGTLRLGGPAEGTPVAEMAVTDMVAPLVADRPLLDGLLGDDEWAGAARVVEPIAPGEAWLVYTQHTADTLYVCVACPSALVVREGQAAEVYLAPASGEATPARLLRLRPEGDQRSALQTFTLKGGQWAPERPAEEGAAVARGAVSGRGDGAWGFAVYEFAVPLAGAEAGQQWRFMARLQVVAHGDAVGDLRNRDPESVVWPDHRTSCTSGGGTPIGLRPNGWAALALQGEGTSDRVAVPPAKRPVRGDGQIGLKEWAETLVATYALPGDEWRRVWLARDEQNLYVAVRLRAARGLRRDESCRVYVDPCGDGGLQPRGDDWQVRLPLGVDNMPQILRPVGAAWQPADALDVKSASYPISTYESTYEFALPLGSLGPDRQPHIAVEVTYGLPQ